MKYLRYINKVIEYNISILFNQKDMHNLEHN